MMTDRFDVHCHLLPNRDDGCKSTDESIACARRMVAAGYTDAFCTPHVWPSLPDNTVSTIPPLVDRLQKALDDAAVPLRLRPGGEINLAAEVMKSPPDQIVTYGMNGKHVLIDLWAERLPAFFDPSIRWFQSHGMQVILAHPERMRAVQDNPDLADHFADLGVLLQGNLQCFADPPAAATRRTAERFLREGRYFMLGSDLHNDESLGLRLTGLHRVEQLLDEPAVRRLMRDNPETLL